LSQSSNIGRADHLGIEVGDLPVALHRADEDLRGLGAAPEPREALDGDDGEDVVGIVCGRREVLPDRRHHAAVPGFPAGELLQERGLLGQGLGILDLGLEVLDRLLDGLVLGTAEREKERQDRCGHGTPPIRVFARPWIPLVYVPYGFAW
jgi:hypothetical protein